MFVVGAPLPRHFVGLHELVVVLRHPIKLVECIMGGDKVWAQIKRFQKTVFSLGVVTDIVVGTA